MASRDSEDKVPGQDVATNSHVQDVVGNKTDTVGGDSLVAHAKINAAAIAASASDVTAIKAVTDVIPDSGAMTSIAQEATLGSPAGADMSTDIAAIKTETASIQTDSTAIKAVTDVIPDAGAMTSIAQEATLGSPAGADMSTDIAAIKTETASIQTDSTAIKAVTDVIPDAGAMTSIAQEATLGSPAGADMSTDIATIDAFHDVPSQDAVTNLQARDVIGNKTDTVAGTSLIGLTKAVKAVSDVIPDSGAMTSIAQEATLGSPAGADMSTDIAALQTDSTAIKAVTDVIPDSGAMTSIAQEATLGSPAGADMSTDIAALQTDSTAIKAVTDVIPDSGAMTSIAQEATIGTPVGADISADIAAVKAETASIQTDSTAIKAVTDVMQPWRRTIKDSIDLTVGVSDNLFTVTGEAECYIYVNITTPIARAAGAVTMEVGTSDDTDLIVPTVTDCRGSIGDVFGGTDAAANVNTRGNICIVSGAAGTTSIVLTIDNACDTGVISAFCIWRPLSTDGAVAVA